MVHLGDIKKIKRAPFVDCITFGSPCQDLSIAGNRAGLAGDRSGLFMDAVRIIREMEEQSGGLYPTFAVWENVPGAFSSNKGEDFRAVVEELAKVKEPGISIPRPENGKWAKAEFICGDGWSIAWRTLDAQFWGVPQRRRRIALVMDFRGQRAGEILFERTGVSGHLEPSIPPWKGIARNPAHSVAGYDRVVEGAEAYTLKIRSGCDGGGKGALVQEEKSATLSTLQNQTLFCSRTVYPNAARALTARYDGSPCVDRGPNLVCLQGNMIDRDVKQNGSGIAERETMFTLNATDRHGVCCAAFTSGQGAKANGIGWAEEQAPTLRTDGGLSAMPTVLCRAQANTNAETYDNLAPTITSSHDGPPIVFESHGQDARYTQQGDTSPACTAQLHKTPLRWIVRRLTPTECERLQGFTDLWTDIGDWTDSKGKRHKTADSPRYKALGNSIALPQWWWLTCKIARYLPEHATLGSLFDGIGGFPLVWEAFHGKGTAVWASEIEPFCIAVTKKHFGGNEI